MKQYTLIITEKPDAAKRIAFALDTKGKPKQMRQNSMPYYVAERDREIVIVPALGHMYTVAAEEKSRNHYPVFNFKWVPRYAVEKNANQIRSWLQAIAKLAEEADMFIDACDYDIEGSLIGYFILKYACNNKEQTSKRMKYSTLTKEELEKSYTQQLPHLDFTLVEAGRARHEIDWLYGVNLSRALTIAAKNSNGKYATLSTGRVQGPTLKFLVKREKTIRTFVPTPYWTIKAQIQINGHIFETQYEKETIETKKEADSIINACKGKQGTIGKIETKQYQQPPPTPFDLGSLQGEAHRIFGYTPILTSKIAQRLYLDALISYPRTSSQKLPSTINYEAILKSLSKSPEYRKPASELLSKPTLKPNEGTKEDPAHPAIHPTGNLPQKQLTNPEKNVFDLNVRRFLAVFSEPATKQTIKVHIHINGHMFYLSGRKILKEGWLHFYQPYIKSEEILLPAIKEGELVAVNNINLGDKFTNPPPRFNPNTVRKRMEKAEIGTKATRAEVIQTLYQRKYATEERIHVTDLGFEVVNVLENYCPMVISANLTRELEEKMNKIQENKEKRESIVADAIEFLKPAITQLKENEKAIGLQLSEAVEKPHLQERIIGTCPTCQTGKLVILRSRKTGKRFAGCTNYFQGFCKTSFPLPQKGLLKPLGRNCRSCGWPTLQVITKGRRPWTLCLNPKCPQKEQRRKAS
jgi:DNA topoisomerase-1